MINHLAFFLFLSTVSFAQTTVTIPGVDGKTICSTGGVLSICPGYTAPATLPTSPTFANVTITGNLNLNNPNSASIPAGVLWGFEIPVGSSIAVPTPIPSASGIPGPQGPPGPAGATGAKGATGPAGTSMVAPPTNCTIGVNWNGSAWSCVTVAQLLTAAKNAGITVSAPAALQIVPRDEYEAPPGGWIKPVYSTDFPITQYITAYYNYGAPAGLETADTIRSVTVTK
jgi:hypothetical protein